MTSIAGRTAAHEHDRPAGGNWTTRLRRRLGRTVPPGQLLRTASPVYVSSLLYVLRSSDPGCSAVVLVSGTILSLGGPAWWHSSSTGHFVELTAPVERGTVLRVHGDPPVGEVLHGRVAGQAGADWITGVICFVGSIGTAFTGYLSQSNFDSQWIGGQAKDGLNSVGIGAWFNVLNPGQMLMWHIVLLRSSSASSWCCT
jgi:hypothetical protein